MGGWAILTVEDEFGLMISGVLRNGIELEVGTVV